MVSVQEMVVARMDELPVGFGTAPPQVSVSTFHGHISLSPPPAVNLLPTFLAPQ